MAQIKLLGKTNLQGKTIFATDLTPTYIITSNVASVNEGSSVTFTLITTNVANGTVLPYTISGISSGDLSSGSLTGSFTVNNGSATTTITLQNDVLTEGAETATLTLNNGAASNFVVVNDTSTTDSDALTYINAVEAADGQALELAVRSAINGFVVGCKADGIWTALKASCILAGARTLNGALVPLVGSSPTNNNFVSGDYNRETGLKGNGSTKRLIANRLNNADPQNSKHIAVYKTEPESSATDTVVLGTRFATSGGHSHLYTQSTSGRQYFAANSVDGGFRTDPGFSTVAVGLIGASRNSSANFVRRIQGVSTNTANNSTAPNSEQIRVFSSNAGGMHSTSRVSFYSVGEHLDLAKLDTRVTALMTAIQAAI